MKNIAVKLSKISKKYILHHEKPTLVESALRFGRKEKIWALKDINLEIEKGEKIGIIGNNGSGKTTLLKIISGITEPTRGKLEANGKIAALISLEAGFHPELTGEENTYLNGMLLGMSKNEVRKNFDKIVEFSGLKKFIDVSLHTYSSGMKLRLGFSIAIHSNPDILLVDEVLTIGDQEFQKKSYHALQEFFQKGKTIIFISHHLPTVAKICPKTVWLERGETKAIGETKKVIKLYERNQKATVRPLNLK